jgi:hypothetical protein
MLLVQDLNETCSRIPCAKRRQTKLCISLFNQKEVVGDINHALRV